MLALLTAVGAWTWGFLQQPQRLERFGLLATLLPAVWAFGLCRVICYIAGGVTRMLRLSLFASVITSVLAGNIWGFRSFIVQEAERRLQRPVVGPDWIESVRMYFAALPTGWKGEVPFLIGGVLGAWIGLRLLKRAESIDVQ
ncbi:MAG: hypothetical protein HYX69_21955 [Planctomycetia bacterium]|nr:hypothetical protein [Planctomycetia bacterium]